jgi:ethanolamine ammonia-lyase large subunit
VTTTLDLIRRGSPVDLVFQSIAGTLAANRSFGVDLALLAEAHEAALSLKRGSVGDNVMYFETGQGSALSANAHHGVDQQTLEARAYAVARRFRPLLINTVVGFIGPEYLYDGKQIMRAGLEDHFCGKLLGVPMGVDVCYTNHADADQEDMDVLLTLLCAANVNFVITVPGADDVMLNYQSLAHHDAVYCRETLNRPPAPEFERWLVEVGLTDEAGRLLDAPTRLTDYMANSRLLEILNDEGARTYIPTATRSAADDGRTGTSRQIRSGHADTRGTVLSARSRACTAGRVVQCRLGFGRSRPE